MARQLTREGRTRDGITAWISGISGLGLRYLSDGKEMKMRLEICRYREREYWEGYIFKFYSSLSLSLIHIASANSRFSSGLPS